ncbi:hypothetical protein [uncultured Roseobacter sp.]|uniref:hypothetical protein n=1 Tax=uncultured Roseobacter sp. TaxID=114847 RepID=UPI00262BA8AC|nr:hypothetical protein [uncultured Roseobacter sp.]
MPRSQPALPPFAASAKYQPSRIYELRTEWTFDHGAQLPLATLNFDSDMDQHGLSERWACELAYLHLSVFHDRGDDDLRKWLQELANERPERMTCMFLIGKTMQVCNRQDTGVPQLLDLFTNRPYASFVAYERVSLIRQAIR